MKELSLNILDIAMNSVKAGAENIAIALDETPTQLTITITDDGCGMSEEVVRRLSDPFYTTRTTRKVGMGVPFYLLAAEQTGGSVRIDSVPAPDPRHGTVITAVFRTDHIDSTPLGDIISTVTNAAIASTNTKVALDKLEAAQKAVDAAAVSVSYEQERYEAGRSSVFDLINAQQKHLKASQDAVQAKYEYFIRQRILDFYQ